MNNVSVSITASGKWEYGLAARESVLSLLEHTSFDIYVTCEPALLELIPRHDRVSINEREIRVGIRADPFLHKFVAWRWMLENSNSDLLVHLDADAVVTAPITRADIESALGTGQMGMVEQTGIAGSDCDRKTFLDHYHAYASAYILPHHHHPHIALSDFRYFNSGLVLFRRLEMENFLTWSDEIRKRIPASHSLGTHMIADQDYLQVWANAMRMGNCTELNWRWNHCPQWDDNFPHPNALVIHLSNFCNGPTLEAITALKKYRSIPISDGEVHPQIIESKKLPISFVVVTYNSDNVISTCLSAVEQCQPAEIIVIDNGSTDNTLNLLAKLTVNVIHNSTNMGFASAANRGAMAATQPNLCFLNPDAEMTVEVARLAIERLMLEREIALVPDYLNTHGMVISGVQPGYSRRKLVGDMLDPTPKLSGAYRRLIRDSGHDHSWTWPLAACLFMSKNYFQSLGGFNEKYFCYMEDVALGQLISGGTGVVESLGKTVVHAGGKGSNVGTEQRRLVLDSARIAYAQSEYGRPFALLLRSLRRGVMFISRSRLNREATIS